MTANQFKACGFIKNWMLSSSGARFFSTSQTSIAEYMNSLDYRKYSTAEDMSKELEDFNSKFNGEEEKVEDVKVMQSYFDKLLEKMKTIRNPPLGNFVIALNNWIENSEQIDSFDEQWKALEKFVYTGRFGREYSWLIF